jgi:acyl carrier protein
MTHSTITGQDRIPLLDELRQIWASTTNAQAAIGENDTFAGIGGDSIGATLCINEIEERFEMRIAMEWLLDGATTLRQLSDRIHELRSSLE